MCVMGGGAQEEPLEGQAYKKKKKSPSSRNVELSRSNYAQCLIPTRDSMAGMVVVVYDRVRLLV